jgi:hypothetical protein
VKARGWRLRPLLGLLINGGGLLVLMDQALTQVLR